MGTYYASIVNENSQYIPLTDPFERRNSTDAPGSYRQLPSTALYNK
jgi:hypothetical protein